MDGERERERETDRRTDGRTDITKLIVNFRNFANTLENVGRIQLRRPSLVGKMMLKLILRTLWLCGWDSKLSHEGFE